MTLIELTAMTGGLASAVALVPGVYEHHGLLAAIVAAPVLFFGVFATIMLAILLTAALALRIVTLFVDVESPSSPGVPPAAR